MQRKITRTEFAGKNQTEASLIKESRSEAAVCIICANEIDMYAVPEKCNHNLICWACILKQRTKLGNKECPICKVASDRVLITNDPSDTLSQEDGRWIEEPDTGIVYTSSKVKNEIQKKTEFSCK